MAVDETREQGTAGEVALGYALRGEPAADRGDAPVPYEYVMVVEVAPGDDVEDAYVAQQQVAHRPTLPAAAGIEGRPTIET